MITLAHLYVLFSVVVATGTTVEFLLDRTRDPALKKWWVAIVLFLLLALPIVNLCFFGYIVWWGARKRNQARATCKGR